MYEFHWYSEVYVYLIIKRAIHDRMFHNSLQDDHLHLADSSHWCTQVVCLCVRETRMEVRVFA